MFSNRLLKSVRILLLPFSFIYWIGIVIRNWLYDSKIFSSKSFNLPVICIGNLSTGGTGKSPMVEFLVNSLKDQHKVAVLSRGYKRKTSGYMLADKNSTASTIGDEPMQFHIKFPDVTIAVGEKRAEAIPQLLKDKPDTDLLILDDAFQHRQVKAGLNILLTGFDNLFTRDIYLPAGDLRDLKSSYKRTDIIVVTKCPVDTNEETRNKIIKEIKPLPHQSIFFTAIEYGSVFDLQTKEELLLRPDLKLILVTGIAKPEPLINWAKAWSPKVTVLQFADHHDFSITDIEKIKKQFNDSGNDTIILTTEKDAVRLQPFKDDLKELPFYIIPVAHKFLFNEEQQFTAIVNNFTNDFKIERED
ncbi:MAG TPA: tetraacyldisaccharide 4'-kinase [Chitinophagaceae bacterium]|nr:tetraacyldisaccharide 4'-kinase [Chitinophagaceae bacterium]